MSELAATRSERIDFLRGVSIFAVLMLHFSLTYKLVDSPLARVLPAAWIRAAVNNGNYGVTIFFVISGFLITSNNLRRFGTLSGVRLRQFYALRFARIVPPLGLALLLILILGLLQVPSFTDSREGQPMPVAFFALAMLSVLTFWHNVLMQFYGYFNYCLNIYWSLSVEEVFYLTFPIACVLLKRNTWIVALCLCAIVIGPIYRSLHSDDEILFMYAYPACFDAIAFGCLVAIFQRRLAVTSRQGVLLRCVAAFGLAVVYFMGIDGHEIFGFSWVAACSAMLLIPAFDLPEARARPGPSSVVAWMGRHSYELYLFHIIVLAGLRDWLPRDAVPSGCKLPLFALFLLVSCGVAWLVAKYFAEPINARLRVGDTQ